MFRNGLFFLLVCGVFLFFGCNATERLGEDFLALPMSAVTLTVNPFVDTGEVIGESPILGSLGSPLVYSFQILKHTMMTVAHTVDIPF